MHPSGRWYSRDHEWVQEDKDGIYQVGITDFAQKQLGAIVYVEVMPKVGELVDAGDEIGSIESVKAVSQIFAPVSGTVVEVNETLFESPEPINDDPHGAGWLIKIKISAKGELDELMDASQYEAYNKDE